MQLASIVDGGAGDLGPLSAFFGEEDDGAGSGEENTAERVQSRLRGDRSWERHVAQP